MNTKLVNTVAGVINAALTQNRTAAGIALALESAQLLQSPETAAELEQARARNAELSAGLPAMQKALFLALDRIAELEAQAEAARAVHMKHDDSEHCKHDGESWPCPTVAALGEAGGETR